MSGIKRFLEDCSVALGFGGEINEEVEAAVMCPACRAGYGTPCAICEGSGIVLRVFMDDLRPAPPGWLLVKTAQEAIKLLVKGQVRLISLDHDLGPDTEDGYTVLLWLEHQVVLSGLRPPVVWVHSANAGARPRMVQAIESINQQIGRTQPVKVWDSQRDTPPEVSNA